MTVVWLGEIDSVKDRGLLGGKATNLAFAARGGFNIPKGFIVTPELNLENQRDKVFAAFDELGNQFVAVRSSGAAEDGSKKSFAGQFRSHLNVTKDESIDAIKDVRASGASARALAYSGSAHTNIPVLVQAMINSDVSGVAFSCNPISGSKTEYVIEAVFGLGELLVSGEVTPDTYMVDTDGKVIEHDKHPQSSKIVRGSAGNEAVIIPKNEQTKSKLSIVEIREIVKLLTDLVRYFKFQVDAEWAYENGKLFLIQVRPITAAG